MKKYETQYEKMTQMPIPQLILSLGIPTTLSMLVTNIYNMVDTMFVGKLGTSASGAVGIVFGFMAILQAFGFMFGQGTGSIISRLLGQKDTKEASKYASTGFFMAVFAGTLIGIIGFIFLEPMMYLLGSTDTILPYAKTYVSFILIAAPFMTSCFTLNNILRYEGKASLAMVGLMAGGILNIIGDPIFMFVFHMGIAGAGLSTALSQFISFCILLYMFLSGKTQSKLSIRHFTRDITDILKITATGLPSLIRQGLGSVSTMLLNQQAAVYGDAAVAAMSIVSRITQFIFSVGLGVGQGYQPVSGFNYGAKRYDRLKEAFRFTLITGEILLGIMVVIVLLGSNQVIGIFRDDAEVIAIGTPALRYQCLALFVQPVSIMGNMTYQSTGHAAGASFLSMLRNGLYFIPVLYLMSNIFGLKGIEMAQPIADIGAFLTAIPFLGAFFRKLGKEDKKN